jgi:hypothetical protein
MRSCTGCGCTDERACPGGCEWASLDPPLCSACADGDFEYPREREPDTSGCPALPIVGPHTPIWTDAATGYCVRCRAPLFYVAEEAA